MDNVELLTLSKVIAIYEHYNYGTVKALFEVSDIDINKKPINTRVLGKKDLEYLKAFFFREPDKTIGGVLPENTLSVKYVGTDCHIIWWEAPQKIEFLTNLELLPTDDYMMPGLVYSCSERDINVYAFKGQTYQLGQQLYRAPIPNVSDDGDLCLGNSFSKVKIVDIITARLHYRDRVWKSKFSAIHGSPFGNKNEKRLYEIFAKLRTAKKFPEEILVKSKVKL